MTDETRSSGDDPPRTMADLLDDVVDRPAAKLSTGFPQLDEVTGGLWRGELVVLGSRPSMGKTALAHNIVENAVLNAGAPTFVYSIETSPDYVASRMLAALAGVDHQHIRRGVVRGHEAERVAAARVKLSAAPLCVEQPQQPTPRALRTRVHQFAENHGRAGLIVVDYVQLMRASIRAENSTDQLAEIMGDLKALAGDFGCPVIVVTQLSRALEGREDRRPRPGDCRGSGTIEEMADTLLFVYREQVYDRRPAEEDIAELIVAKQRSGPPGLVTLEFREETVRFVARSVDQKPEPPRR